MLAQLKNYLDGKGIKYVSVVHSRAYTMQEEREECRIAGVHLKMRREQDMEDRGDGGYPKHNCAADRKEDGDRVADFGGGALVLRLLWRQCQSELLPVPTSF